MLMRTLKMMFWVLYDHLGKLLIANILCACSVAAPAIYAFRVFVSGEVSGIVWITLPLLLSIGIIVVPLLFVGLLWMIKELIEKHDGSLKTFFSGIRRFGLRAVAISVALSFAALCLISSMWFYGAKISAQAPVIGYALSAVSVWALLFTLLTALLALPALVNKNAGVGTSLKTAAILVVDNPLFVAGVAFHGLVVLLFSIAPPVFFLFSFVPLAALLGSAYEMLSRKYAAIQAYVAAGGNRDKPMVIDFGDDNDEYLCRGIRDVLFPWKE